eukprot:302602-Chlamydomonas_euryale.AAC.7
MMCDCTSTTRQERAHTVAACQGDSFSPHVVRTSIADHAYACREHAVRLHAPRAHSVACQSERLRPRRCTSSAPHAMMLHAVHACAGSAAGTRLSAKWRMRCGRGLSVKRLKR